MTELREFIKENMEFDFTVKNPKPIYLKAEHVTINWK